MATPAKDEFRNLLRELRDEEPQSVYAARELGMLRQTYGMYEGGHRKPTETLRAALVAAHPDQRERIDQLFAQAVAEWELEQASRPRRLSKAEREIQRRITGMMSVGRTREARAAIDRALEDENLGARIRVWLHEQEGVVNEETQWTASSDEASQKAIQEAHAAGLHEEELPLCLALARRLHVREDFSQAQAVLDEGLRRHPDAKELWRRKGIVCWYEHRYSEAYACLMTAHAHGIPKTRILHARGQVLIEWGSIEEGIRDLDAAIEKSPLPASRAYARSTRAFGLGQLGRLDEAISEFAEAEKVVPENAWLHYFRALCYGENGDEEKLIEGLRTALSCDVPRLNPAKRLNALRILKQHGVTIELK